MSKNAEIFKKFLQSVHGDGWYLMKIENGDLTEVEPAGALWLKAMVKTTPEPVPVPKPVPTIDQRYNAAQVAEALGVTRQTIYNWIEHGLLPAVRVGRRSWYVTQAQLDTFLRAGVPSEGAGSRKGPAAGKQLPLPDEYLPAGSGKLSPITKQPTKKKRRV